MADTALGSQVSAPSPLLVTDKFAIARAGNGYDATLQQLREDILGLYLKRLTADQSNSTVTPTKVTGLDLALPVGTYRFKYTIRYQAAAITTGVRFDVNFSGTVTTFIWNQIWVDASATAATATPDQDNIQAAGAVIGAFGSRAKGTAGRGTTLGVDTAAADMLMIIDGLMVVTVAGNLELYHGSEVAAASTVKADSLLEAQKAV